MIKSLLPCLWNNPALKGEAMIETRPCRYTVFPFSFKAKNVLSLLHDYFPNAIVRHKHTFTIVLCNRPAAKGSNLLYFQEHNLAV